MSSLHIWSESPVLPEHKIVLTEKRKYSWNFHLSNQVGKITDETKILKPSCLFEATGISPPPPLSQIWTRGSGLEEQTSFLGSSFVPSSDWQQETLQWASETHNMFKVYLKIHTGFHSRWSIGLILSYTMNLPGKQGPCSWM